MNEALTQKTLSASFWVFIQSGGQQLVKFGLTVILARLLLPDAFGVVAMLEVILAISERVVKSGFGGALIQKKEVSQVELATLFYHSLCVGLLVYGGLYLSAPAIANFFEQTELIGILRVSAISLVFMALQVPQNVQIIREMRFKDLTVATLFSVLCAAVVGITCALSGLGLWSLVWSGFTRKFVEMVIMCKLGGWLPTLDFSKVAWKHIMKLGGSYFGANVLSSIFSNIHTIIIGKAYSAATLGFFNRARGIQDVSLNTATAPLLSVLFPSFSRIHHDKKRLSQAYLRVLATVAYIAIPIAFCVSLLAEPLIVTVYTSKWLQSVPYLEWMVLFGAAVPLLTVTSSIVRASGRAATVLWLSACQHSITLSAIALTYQHGVIPLIIGVGISHVLLLGLYFNVMKKTLGTAIIRQLNIICLPVLVALLLWLGIRGLFEFHKFDHLWAIIVGGGIFWVSYLFISFLFRFTGLISLLQATHRYWGKFSICDKLFSRVIHQ